jgi:hypothetical protein
MWPFRWRPQLRWRPKRPQSDLSNELYRLYLKRGRREHLAQKWHHYFDIYAQKLERFRGSAPTILEIGVHRGGSLAIWRDWLGPGARVYGLDLDPSCAENPPQGTRIFVGDQSDRAVLRHILEEIGTPDIIVDDGGHTAVQQITTFEEIYHRMAPEGVYIVEDTHTALWGGEFDDHPEGISFLDFAFSRVKELHGWTGQRAFFGRYNKPPELRAGMPVPEVSEFTRTTRAISFFDSVVVFERGARDEPWAQYR